MSEYRLFNQYLYLIIMLNNVFIYYFIFHPEMDISLMERRMKLDISLERT